MGQLIHTCVLDENDNVVYEDNVPAWFTWFSENYDQRCHVERTVVNDVMVSTVFLGVANPFHGPFETMCFAPDGGVWDYAGRRSDTRQAALAVHESFVKAIRDGAGPDDA
jgi:hypothetical protein